MRTNRHHSFRLPSLHRLNTKDLAAPPTALGATSNKDHVAANTADPPQPHHMRPSYHSTCPGGSQVQLTSQPSSPTSPTSDTSYTSYASTSATSYTSSSAGSSAAAGSSRVGMGMGSMSRSRLKSLLLLRRKQSRIALEHEMADERQRFGGLDGGAGLLGVMEPRPRGVEGFGGIFEVLGRDGR